jgi:hypothetical protein
VTALVCAGFVACAAYTFRLGGDFASVTETNDMAANTIIIGANKTNERIFRMGLLLLNGNAVGIKCV